MRHSTRGRSHFRVRLACVKHAASVQSEPESNSPVEKYLIQRTYCSQIELKALIPNSLFTCQRTVPLTRGGVALCNFSFHLSTTFFKFFFRQHIQRGARSSRCASARFRVMPTSPRFVKHFFAVFSHIFHFFCYNITVFITFFRICIARRPSCS